MGKYIVISAMFDIQTNDRGVSPVIGVILMVAITVILAAVIGTFVLDLAGNVEQNAQASVTLDGNTVTVVSAPNADTIGLEGSGGTTATIDPATAGATADVSSFADGDITVTATLNGNTTVIQTLEK